MSQNAVYMTFATSSCNPKSPRQKLPAVGGDEMMTTTETKGTPLITGLLEKLG
jgi:hypothetical protein